MTATEGALERALATTLELIAPGGRFRVSPAIVDTQVEVLFGTPPGAANRECAIENTLRSEAGTKLLERLSAAWKSFESSGKAFVPDAYNEEFLLLYLAYYLPVNVAKLQLLLVEILRRGAWPQKLKVLDLGVGCGTTAVAVLDLLRTLETCLQVQGGLTPPWRDVTFRFVDARRENLAFAKRVVEAYVSRADALDQLGAEKPSFSLRDQIAKAEWLHLGLGQAPSSLAEDSTLLVASNILSELQVPERERLSDLIGSLPSGSIAVLIEPGDRARTLELNSWRQRAIEKHSRIRVLMPCGEEARGLAQAPCGTCWNARRENLHPSSLHRAILSQVREGNVSEHDNRLLSWSYSVLASDPGKPLEPSSRKGLEQTNESVSGPLRFVGTFRNLETATFQSGPLEDSSVSDSWKEYLRLCPISAGSPSLLFRRAPGDLIPRIAHGDTIEGRRLAIEKQDRGTILTFSSPESRLIAPGGVQTPVDQSFLMDYSPAVREGLNRLASRWFGFPRLREFQHQVLDRTVRGKNTFVLAATGGGKSECYILPALLLPGISVVISPLKALMKDQFEQRLGHRFGLQDLATVINSDVPFRDREARLKRMELGAYKLVYFTPEQLERGHVLDSIRRANDQVGVRYLAVDEAHCISQWGHDFRPSYLNVLSRLRDRGLRPVRIALTATASPRVQRDVCDELELDGRSADRGGDVLVYSSNRPELDLVVRTCESEHERAEAIRLEVRNFQRHREEVGRGSALIFLPHTGKRAKPHGLLSSGVEPFAAFLEKDLGSPLSRFHGQMNGRIAALEQDSFVSGTTNIMVATKGFGMGVDKPDIRLVIHRTAPVDLEAYVQEAGRAGRDGVRARVVVFAPPRQASDGIQSDASINDYFMQQRSASWSEVQELLQFLREGKCYERVASELVFTSAEAIGDLNARKSARDWDAGRVNRVLQAALGLRAPGQARDSAVLIEHLRDVHPVVTNLKLKNLDGILNSGHYFAEVLREREVSEQEFRDLLDRATQPDRGLIDLARRLGTRLSEAQSFITDIRQAEGSFGQRGWWEPALIDFRLANPRKAKYAWELRLGQFSAQDETVLRETFQHDLLLRQRNNRDAYDLMVSQYLGVAVGGASATKPSSCLRSVLLGYLKTREIVVGQDCGSCSRCRPAEDFEADMAKRRAVVEQLSHEEELLFERFSGATDQLTPDVIEAASGFWARVAQAEAQGRSLDGYARGWLLKLSNESPGHPGASLLRLQGLAEGLFEERGENLRIPALSVLRSTSLQSLAPALNVLERLSDSCRRYPDLSRLIAQGYDALGRASEALPWWIAASSAPDDYLRLEASRRVVTLLLDKEGGTKEIPPFLSQIARLTRQANEALSCYRRLPSDWSVERLKEEIDYLQSRTDGKTWASLIGPRLVQYWTAAQAEYAKPSPSRLVTLVVSLELNIEISILTIQLVCPEWVDWSLDDLRSALEQVNTEDSQRRLILEWWAAKAEENRSELAIELMKRCLGVTVHQAESHLLDRCRAAQATPDAVRLYLAILPLMKVSAIEGELDLIVSHEQKRQTDLGPRLLAAWSRLSPPTTHKHAMRIAKDLERFWRTSDSRLFLQLVSEPERGVAT